MHVSLYVPTEKDISDQESCGVTDALMQIENATNETAACCTSVILYHSFPSLKHHSQSGTNEVRVYIGQEAWYHSPA